MLQGQFMGQNHSMFTMGTGLKSQLLMKRKMWIFIGSLLCIALIVGYVCFYNYLPPRTPLKIARVQSDLQIPSKWELLDFKEEYSFNGEGEIYILFQMSEVEIENIIQESIGKKYKKLTQENLISDKLLNESTMKTGYNIHGKNLSEITNGYYRLEANNLNGMDFGLTVLNIEKMELIVYVSIP